MNSERWNLDLSEQMSLGKSIRQIVNLKSDSGPELQAWFQGNEKYFNISVFSAENDITSFQITLRGSFLDWKRGRLTWGQTTEFELPESLFPATNVLRPNQTLNIAFVRIVLGVLKNSPELPLIQKLIELIGFELGTN